MTFNAQTPDTDHTQRTRWYVSWKAYIIGIAGILSAAVIFHREFKSFVLVMEEILPHDIALSLPYSRTKIRDAEIRNILLSRYVDDTNLENIFGKPISIKRTSYHNIPIKSSVYQGQHGTLVISRVADAIVSWSLAPKILPNLIRIDLRRSHLDKVINLKDIYKYYSNSNMMAIDIDGQKTHTSISFSALPFDGSPIYNVSYSFYPKLNCGEGFLSRSNYSIMKSMPCSDSEISGVLTMLSYTQLPDLFELASKYKNIDIMEMYAQVNQTAIDGTQMVIREALIKYIGDLQ